MGSMPKYEAAPDRGRRICGMLAAEQDDHGEIDPASGRSLSRLHPARRRPPGQGAGFRGRVLRPPPRLTPAKGCDQGGYRAGEAAHRAALAAADDACTVVTDVISGRPCHYIRNAMIDDLVASGLQPLPVPAQQSLAGERYECHGTGPADRGGNHPATACIRLTTARAKRGSLLSARPRQPAHKGPARGRLSLNAGPRR
jgi:hypothetical protein